MEEDIKILEDIVQEVFEFVNDSYEMNRREVQAIENLLTRYKYLEENQLWSEATIEELKKDFIPKSKIKDFFSSRLEKYQEADDGRYEQDYLTRGELELVDRYKECKEIAKIILEEEVNSEVPQDCIPKSKIKEIIEWWKKEGCVYGSERLLNKLQELLEDGD